MPRLQNKVALVTGGGSGIGLGSARRLIEEGAFVYITGRDQQRLEAAASSLGERATAVVADATDPDRMRAVTQRISDEHDRIDIVFANAGAAWYDTIEDVSPENLDKGLALDVKGTVYTVQAALPFMPDGAAILLNTSITKDMGLPTFGVYAAAKAALRSFTRTWANELRGRRIRVNAISPGVIETEAYAKDMGEQGAKDYVARVVEEILVGRVGVPQDIGNAVVFLASDEASYINGVELTVDGGQTQVYAGHN